MIRRLAHRLLHGPAQGYHEAHVICLPGPGIAYIRVPKAANSSIKSALAMRFGIRARSDRTVAQDGFWDDTEEGLAKRMTPERFVSEGHAAKCWTFSFVRHPAARLQSCWNNKVIENDALSPRFLAMGVRPGMPFDAFVQAVAETPDDRADIHVHSQSGILEHQGRLVPDFVGRVETIDSDWAHVAARIEARSGVAMGKLGERNRRVVGGENQGLTMPDKLRALIFERYKRDFDLFYPDQSG
ncbi:hypothetical protein RAZWK3B_03375 [Roseobacter sp. AzwK-3b]|uniref:sulfotransferase family protein n=1 Tax=Roseobacter sp. AzwK-3b TaxID=351016 RepID=UPI0001568F73|nr:sulfotransferase family protein [Roseobacter sp. AzwK-3b]EDM73229.1 hypothetical protein RAZWK3B_03375 [Roseobacter sp. AzwK-3b]